MMCHLIEEIIPREYFTNMVSLTADINLLSLFMKEKVPLLHAHLKKLNFQLEMVVVELFITAFSLNKTACTDIIIDAMLLEGSSVYFKTMLAFFRIYQSEMLAMKEFCSSPR